MFDRGYWRLSQTVKVDSVFGYSDQYSSSYSAAKAVNGSTGDYWQTRNPTGAYIIVELAEAAAIESLRWYVGNTTYYAKAFTVAGSNDGETFTDLFTGGCTNTTGWQGFGWVNETPYKYIRVTCNTPGNTSRLYTYELEFGIVEKKYFDQSYGKYIVAVFDGPVTAPTDNDANHFSVLAPKAEEDGGGDLIVKSTPRTIVSVVSHPDVANALLITLADTERLDECGEPVVLSYDGAGTLMGYGRPVEAFSVEFNPQGIAYKGDQNNTEHVEISNIAVESALIEVAFHDVRSPVEHIDISGIEAVGVLTHVDDI